MTERITDIAYSHSSPHDFVIRRRYPTLPQLAVIFFSIVLIGASVVIAVSDKTALISILFILGGASGWYMATLLQRNRDQLLATEFQNALFSSALGMNHKFCFIIKRDGSIIYQDRSFQDMFPDFIRQSARTLDLLLNFGKVSAGDQNRIFSAIEQGIYEKIIFDIRGGEGKFEKIIMTMEPILRPSGFVLMRGREYVESRASDEARQTQEPAQLFNKSTMSLFTSVMDMMSMGVYMTDAQGHFIYMNPALLRWLEYTPEEAGSNTLSLQRILHTGGGVEIGKSAQFEGELMLQKKTGAMVKCYLTQKTIYDERNKVVGSTGIVQHMLEQGQTGNKLW